MNDLVMELLAQTSTQPETFGRDFWRALREFWDNYTALEMYVGGLFIFMLAVGVHLEIDEKPVTGRRLALGIACAFGWPVFLAIAWWRCLARPDKAPRA